MSPLFTLTEGQGLPLLVLHGWGMNHRVWQRIRPALTQDFQVTWVDLPGHGHSHALSMTGLEALVVQLEPLLQPGMVIMGWSLGGLVAQRLAQLYPERVRALILVASTPSFVQRPHWSHALPVAVLDEFAENLQQDYQATVKRFFALQFMGARNDPGVLHALRDQVMALPASSSALASGLAILKQTDFTAETTIVPTLWLLGRMDKLIPVGLASVLDSAESAGLQQVVVMDKAAHVPFVTHPEAFMQAVLTFIGGLEKVDA